MDLIIALVLVAVFLISAYWYSNLVYKYWEKLGVPSVPAIFPVGSQLTFFLKILHEVELERYKKYGRIYGHYEGLRPTLNVAEPELLRNILVKDFANFSSRRDLSVGDPIADNMVSVMNGEKWKRVRNAITPAFTTGKIKRMTSIILDSTKTLLANFDSSISRDVPVDAKRLFGAFTMDVIASSAFATKIDSHNDPDNKFVEAARKVFTRNVNWRFVLFFLFPQLMKLLRISVFSSSAMQFFKEATLEIIKERKRTGKGRNDFLQLLLEATDEMKNKQPVAAENEEEDDEEKSSQLKFSSDRGLTHDEVIAQCIIFFLAGYDTTASTLSFASFELAQNPDCQKRLAAEIDSAIANNGGEISYDAVQNMKYLDYVINETLRKYPPAVRLERQADDDYELGDTGITVKKGMIVGTPVYAMHYDPEFYPDPETFDPERFTPEAKSQRHAYTFLPFGAGPRNCVGMRFALMEIKICLAEIFRNYTVNLNPKTKVPLDYYLGQGLLQPKDILLDFQKRATKT